MRGMILTAELTTVYVGNLAAMPPSRAATLVPVPLGHAIRGHVRRAAARDGTPQVHRAALAVRCATRGSIDSGAPVARSTTSAVEKRLPSRWTRSRRNASSGV